MSFRPTTITGTTECHSVLRHERGESPNHVSRFHAAAWERAAWTLCVRSMGKASAVGNDAERRGRAFPRGAWERERLACPVHRSFNRNMANWPCTILGGRASVRAASKPGSVGASPSPFHASPFSGSSTAHSIVTWLTGLARSWEVEPPCEPRQNRARSEPRPPRFTQVRLVGRQPPIDRLEYRLQAERGPAEAGTPTSQMKSDKALAGSALAGIIPSLFVRRARAGRDGTSRADQHNCLA
jgi:hypothetical protein